MRKVRVTRMHKSVEAKNKSRLRPSPTRAGQNVEKQRRKKIKKNNNNKKETANEIE